MIVELVGCSGAGKSTLCDKIGRHLEKNSFNVSDSFGVVFGQRLSKVVASPTFRNIFLETIPFARTLSGIVNHKRFCEFAVERIKENSVNRAESIRLYRSLARKLAVHTCARRKGSRSHVILVDEGTIHLAHVLLGRGDGANAHTDTFASLVPTPDVVVWVQAPQALIHERLCQRGELPAPDRNAETRQKFIDQSNGIFGSVLRQIRGAHLVLADNSVKDARSLDSLAASVACQVARILSDTRLAG